MVGWQSQTIFKKELYMLYFSAVYLCIVCKHKPLLVNMFKMQGLNKL